MGLENDTKELLIWDKLKNIKNVYRDMTPEEFERFIDTLAGDVDAILEDINYEFQLKIEDLEDEKQQQEEDISGLCYEVDDLQIMLEEAKEEVDNLQTMLDDANSEVASLQTDVAILQDDIDFLESERGGYDYD